jgi:hypothetical protein
MQLTDSEEILKMVESVEEERKRLAGWAFKPEFDNHPEIKNLYLFRCRRLAKIRENLRLLAESYE